MKKQIIVALAIAVSALSFAQKKELKTAEKAIKSSKYSEAKAAINQAESMVSAMDEKTKAKFYYLKGQAFYANGKGSDVDTDAALESLSKVEGNYVTETEELKQTMSNGFLTIGNEAYGKKDYSKASKFFEKSYRVTEKDTIFLYYAAATAVNVKEYDRALGLYEELKTLGYTGIEEQYVATDKQTGEIEVFQSSNLRDLSVKTGTHIKPTIRKTESKRSEIVKNVALIYVSEGQSEKAIKAMKDARAENPDDVNLVLSEANLHYKMGNTEEFSRLLVKATEMDPKNPELQYNLGVIAAEADHPEEAKAHYEKAIELDSDYINAYINLAALILAGEQPLIEEMNGLGSSSADNKRYDELREERQVLYKDAIPYLTKALEIAPENINAAKTLMNIYSILGETDKYKEIKANIEEIESAQ
jgi:tetratricopeptide (TPR) repeat protein